MRVIAGSAKGTRLARVPAGTRPLSDRAREGLFSSLGSRVREARCADVFAGTGALGIEALSRGAASCLFVDRSPAAIRTIRENLGKTGLNDRARVIRADLLGWRPPRRGLGLALADPPYRFPRGSLRKILDNLVEGLESGGLVVLTRPARDTMDVIPVNWHVVTRLSYGDARVLICREGP